MIETSSFKWSFSEKVGELSLDLGALRDPLSINPGRFGESRWSGDSVYELSIRSLRVFLYLLGIATISDFSSAPPTACLRTCFRTIVTIRFWCRRGVLAQVFPRQAYAPMKQSFSIGSIVHQPLTYQSHPFEPIAQIKLRFFPGADSNYANVPPDLRLQQQT